MAEIKTKSSEARDYKERFEFRLTVGDNIICQRYFKIQNFNPRSLSSYDLLDAITHCVTVIDDDLKMKSQIYSEICCPRIFNTVEEMTIYFSDEAHRAGMRLGEGIVVKNSSRYDYFWGNNNRPEQCEKFDNGEFTTELKPEDYVDYKFGFYVDGREVAARMWTGVYPKFVRNSIDLSNKRGKLEEGESPYNLNFEQYLLYKLTEGKYDLIWGIIKEICDTCSYADKKDYTVSEKYGDKVYKNSWK